jgi:hypothetical protein
MYVKEDYYPTEGSSDDTLTEDYPSDLEEDEARI